MEVGRGYGVQRLFVTFLRGWPGIGLLLLRVAIGLMALAEGGLFLYDLWPDWGGSVVGVVLGGIGCLLLAGLWTPIASSAFAAVLITIYVYRATTPAGINSPQEVFLAIAIAVAIAMLGPGAVSLDYFFFGPREIVIFEMKRSR